MSARIVHSAYRCERASAGLTGSLDFAHWTEVFGHEHMMAVLPDCLLHRSTMLSLIGERHQVRQSLPTKTHGEEERNATAGRRAGPSQQSAQRKPGRYEGAMRQDQRQRSATAETAPLPE